jgi:hypothetical protein
VAANLFTEENFVYYEVMLEHLVKEFGPKLGTRLVWLFLDMICQFEPYWKRYASFLCYSCSLYS